MTASILMIRVNSNEMRTDAVGSIPMAAACPLRPALAIQGKRLLSGVLVATVGFTFLSLALAETDQRSHEIYTPRYEDGACPPEYPESRARMEAFIQAAHMGGELRRFFGNAAPRSMQDVRRLTVEDHAGACAFLANQYDKMINTQVRLFDGSDAYYWHDLTFYEGGDFYFVAISGGFFIEEDPENPGKERIATRHGRGVEVLLKRDFIPVPLGFLSDPDLCEWEPNKQYLMANELIREICAAESDDSSDAR